MTGTLLGDPLVRIEGVTKTFPGPSPVRVLAHADIEVSAGEFTAIVGRSGSGKSTLLNILGLLDTPTQGQYWLQGEDVSGLDERRRTRLRRRHVSFVFQAFHLSSLHTVLENVELGLLYQGVPRHERRDRAGLALEAVGLGHRRDAPAATLSGGEKQRAAIARAVARRTQLLLCDEPTGNLDSETASAVVDLLAGLARDGIGVVLVTHDRDLAASADSVVTIEDGSTTSARQRVTRDG